MQSIAITGPLNATGPGDTPSRRRIFVCRPAAESDEVACAKKIATTLPRVLSGSRRRARISTC